MRKKLLLYGIILLLLIHFSCREMPNINNTIRIQFAQKGLVFENISDKLPITIIAFYFFYYDKQKDNYEVFGVGYESLRRTLDKNEYVLSSDEGFKTDFRTNTYYTYDMRTTSGNIDGSFIIIDTENPAAEYEIDFQKTRYLRILQNNSSAR